MARPPSTTLPGVHYQAPQIRSPPSRALVAHLMLTARRPTKPMVAVRHLAARLRSTSLPPPRQNSVEWCSLYPRLLHSWRSRPAVRVCTSPRPAWIQQRSSRVSRLMIPIAALARSDCHDVSHVTEGTVILTKWQSAVHDLTIPGHRDRPVVSYS